VARGGDRRAADRGERGYGRLTHVGPRAEGIETLRRRRDPFRLPPPATMARRRKAEVRPPGITCLVAAVCGCWVSASAAQQPTPDIATLLTRVGQRVVDYYHRAQSLVCLEKSMVQPIDSSWSSQGFSRSVESELRVEADNGQAPGEAAILRKVRKVNGRVPREKDKKDRAGCTDPNPLSSEPLAFLLPAHRSEYQFSAAKIAKDRDRPALVIDFASVNRRSKPELIEDPGGHDDCFDWSGHIASRGRVWVDAENYDVVRVERGLGGPVDVRVPLLIQRRHHLDGWVVIIRDDVTIRYKTVAFSEPDEVLLLPESIHSFTMVRGGLQSTRRTQTFSDYKRFVAGGRVLQ